MTGQHLSFLPRQLLKDLKTVENRLLELFLCTHVGYVYGCVFVYMCMCMCICVLFLQKVYPDGKVRVCVYAYIRVCVCRNAEPSSNFISSCLVGPESRPEDATVHTAVRQNLS